MPVNLFRSNARKDSDLDFSLHKGFFNGFRRRDLSTWLRPASSHGSLLPASHISETGQVVLWPSVTDGSAVMLKKSRWPSAAFE